MSRPWDTADVSQTNAPTHTHTHIHKLGSMLTAEHRTYFVPSVCVRENPECSWQSFGLCSKTHLKTHCLWFGDCPCGVFVSELKQ